MADRYWGDSSTIQLSSARGNRAGELASANRRSLSAQMHPPPGRAGDTAPTPAGSTLGRTSHSVPLPDVNVVFYTGAESLVCDCYWDKYVSSELRTFAYHRNLLLNPHKIRAGVMTSP
jgi:hypothetical protein